ncbi:MAG: hypothetical protein HXS44_09650 [Theionarchaea archaeon]|nr:hypothetical protein [Theionarchaea archaeon]
MKKRLSYGIAITILAILFVTSFVSCRRSQYYEGEQDILARSVSNFAQKLNLADDELPLHDAGDEHPFYRNDSQSQYFYAHNLYQKISIASASIGFVLALILIYYASRSSFSK